MQKGAPFTMVSCQILNLKQYPVGILWFLFKIWTSTIFNPCSFVMFLLMLTIGWSCLLSKYQIVMHKMLDLVTYYSSYGSIYMSFYE